jgi:hypothetical protein
MSAGIIEGRFPIGEAPIAIEAPERAEAPAGAHHTARQVLVQALSSVLGRAPSLSEVQAAQAVGWRESNYGRGWRGDGVGSKNWGAVQAGRPPCDPARSFLYTDTHPTSSGASVPYQICFRRYSSDIDGAADMARHIFIRRPKTAAAAASGSLEAFSTAMYDEHYYEGFGKTRKERIRRHMQWIDSALDKITAALGEPKALGAGTASVGAGGAIVGLVALGGLLLFARSRSRAG